MEAKNEKFSETNKKTDAYFLRNSLLYWPLNQVDGQQMKLFFRRFWKRNVLFHSVMKGKFNFISNESHLAREIFIQFPSIRTEFAIADGHSLRIDTIHSNLNKFARKEVFAKAAVSKR